MKIIKNVLFVSVYMYYKGTNTTMHKYLTYLVALNAFWSIGWAIYGMAVSLAIIMMGLYMIINIQQCLEVEI